MPKGEFSSDIPNLANRIGRLLAAGIAHLNQLESRMAKRGLIVSDVFGADVFIQREARPPILPQQMPPGDACAHWDEALDFEPPPHAAGEDFPRFLSSGLPPGKSSARDIDAEPSCDALTIPANARASDIDPVRVLPPPLFLYRSQEDHAEHATPGTHSAFRLRWQMFAIAACLVVAWIGSGQSDPLADKLARPQIRNPAADALADTFAGAPSGSIAAETVGAEHDAARLLFAPRFAVLYANAISTTGSVDAAVVNADADKSAAPNDETDDEVLALSRDAALVMIRNLPDGTTLSTGTRVSPTDWVLSSGDLSSIVVTLPDNRSGPVRANIEVFGMSGTSAGTVAVEIRERAGSSQRASTARHAKVYRTAGGRSAEPKRRSKPSPAEQMAAKPNAAKIAVVSAAQSSPATQQILPQLPFLPGPHSATPPPGTTVAQQILINLGVAPSAAIVGLTQKN